MLMRLYKEVMAYFKVRVKIHIIDDIILNIISIRYSVLNYHHKGHMGIQRCQSLARHSLYVDT